MIELRTLVCVAIYIYIYILVFVSERPCVYVYLYLFMCVCVCVCRETQKLQIKTAGENEFKDDLIHFILVTVVS